MHHDHLNKSKDTLSKIKNKLLISLYLFFALFFVSCKTTAPTGEEKQAADFTGSFSNIIPKPVSVSSADGFYLLDKNTSICLEPLNSETMFIGNYLAEKMRSSTGFSLPVLKTNDSSGIRNIYLTINHEIKSLSEEGYKLSITEEEINLSANTPEGLFRGVQTLRQIFPPSIESSEIQPGLWKIPTGKIIDYPRFKWRGVMLDVARHFFSVDVVKSYIDLTALYKINYFHIHLSDDQGWRIQINSWPKLAVYGGSTEVGGGKGGYYTHAEYSEIVKYARERYITVVPEIDMPGHTNAALASYPELTFDGSDPTLYTGIDVGFSALDIQKDITFKFVNDVIKELSTITPGPYIHIGGDEAPKIDSLEYVNFIDSVQNIVHFYGKEMIGWDEISKANLDSGTIAQHWANDIIQNAIKQGVKVLMSPASKTYLDMKYDSTTTLGLFWAGYVEVKDAYNWDPASQIKGIPENSIIGVEAPLWSETLTNLNDIEYMAFPRLAGHAEIGWSQVKGRNWDEYKERLAEQGLRWKEMGVNFYHSPQVLWK